MDEDTIALVRQLCCQLGMMMEDVSPMAIMAPRDLAPLRITVAELENAAERMNRIARAANALLGQ
jgi:hypothetical protein